MDNIPIIVVIFLIVILLIAGIYIAVATRWRLKNRYEQELELLDKQLRDKQINEETYEELKRDLEKKYKRYSSS